MISPVVVVLYCEFFCLIHQSLKQRTYWSPLTFVSGAGAELDEQERQQQQPHVHVEARGTDDAEHVRRQLAGKTSSQPAHSYFSKRGPPLAHRNRGGFSRVQSARYSPVSCGSTVPPRETEKEKDTAK